MENKIFKVAVVGCGSISANHLHGLNANENVKIVALCDVIPERAEARAKEYSVDCKIYTDYYELIEKEELDAVHICTPHYLHAPMTIAALKKNINVFLEKPACISTSEIEEMLKAEKESLGMVCVSFQNRFNPSTLLAKKLIEEDGGARHAFGTIFWHRNDSYYTDSGWRGKKATEGGGVMINQAIHTIDLLCEFLGKPESVCATVSNHHLKGVIDVEDSAEGIIYFENGKQASFYFTTDYPGRDTTLISISTKKHRIDVKAPNIFIDDVKVEDPSLVNDFYGKECYGNGHKELIRAFYDAIRDGKDSPISLESAQYALRILLASYESFDNKVKI
jgi:predicted dehydrogenase